MTVVKKAEKVQDAKYWANRKLHDKEKDWNYDEFNWLEGYIASVEHPHRQQIVDIVREFFPSGSILEIGCNVGPNLLKLQEAFPETQLAGIDVNELALEKARKLLPNPIFKLGNVTSIPFESKSFNLVISDSVLLYVGPKEITQALDEIDRVTTNGIVLVERYAESLEGKVVGHVWGRDYKKLLEQRGFQVEERELIWPTSKNWEKYGKLFVCRRV